MTSSRYATGRVCQVVAGDSVKCTKMASVHEKTVAQGSVVAHAKWSQTQVLLYEKLTPAPPTPWDDFLNIQNTRCLLKNWHYNLRKIDSINYHIWLNHSILSGTYNTQELPSGIRVAGNP